MRNIVFNIFFLSYRNPGLVPHCRCQRGQDWYHENLQHLKTKLQKKIIILTFKGSNWRYEKKEEEDLRML